MNRLVYLLAVAGLLALTACSQVIVRTSPQADFAGIKHPYVVHLLSDARGIDRAIANELRARGYAASFGARTEMPDDADVVVLYQDHWTTDFTTYMIGIDIQVRTARTDKPLAITSYFKPSITGDTPADVIDVILKKIFPAKPGLPPLPPEPDQPDLVH
jgi:hypothetical protein